ncbi:protein S100-A9 [Mastomys coucha]|uniref:protein S100-A9 n=1 Tax=Mastomys coucha TaxID=35658 RepID=UPI0012619598|nr:protein S100-A9 [Mastomys coucha]XP_031231933.1 protein S100-A9 [Mastomys coucha]
MATRTSQMERNIGTIIDTFHQYSRREGHHDTLSKKEFRDLVKMELATFMKKENRSEAIINDIMEDLDTNQDNQLTFEESMMLMAKLVFACHEKLHANNPRGHGHSHGKGCGK